MHKSLLRIVSLFLVPCLILDPLATTAFASTSAPLAIHSANISVFQEQALEAGLVAATRLIFGSRRKQNADLQHQGAALPLASTLEKRAINQPPAIVVAEDFDPWRERLVKKLKELRPDHEIVAATNGSEAWEHIQSLIAAGRQVGLLHTDGSMPELTGYDLIKQVVKAYPHIPIILNTSDASPELAEAYEALGRVKVVSKFCFTAVAEAVEQLLPAALTETPRRSEVRGFQGQKIDSGQADDRDPQRIPLIQQVAAALKVLGDVPIVSFTPREEQVVALIRSGETNGGRIGSALRPLISRQAVRLIVEKILEKLSLEQDRRANVLGNDPDWSLIISIFNENRMDKGQYDLAGLFNDLTHSFGAERAAHIVTRWLIPFGYKATSDGQLIPMDDKVHLPSFIYSNVLPSNGPVAIGLPYGPDKPVTPVEGHIEPLTPHVKPPNQMATEDPEAILGRHPAAPAAAHVLSNREFVLANQSRLDELKHAYAWVLRGRYLEGKTQSALADERGVFQSAVSDLERRALAALRELITNGILTIQKWVNDHRMRLDELKESYAWVLRGRYLEGKKLQNLADERGVTNAAISHLEHYALDALWDLVHSGTVSNLKLVRDHENRLDELKSSYAWVLRGRYSEGNALKVLADERGVSTTAISQLERRALTALRKLVGNAATPVEGHVEPLPKHVKGPSSMATEDPDAILGRHPATAPGAEQEPTVKKPARVPKAFKDSKGNLHTTFEALEGFIESIMPNHSGDNVIRWNVGQLTNWIVTAQWHYIGSQVASPSVIFSPFLADVIYTKRPVAGGTIFPIGQQAYAWVMEGAHLPSDVYPKPKRSVVPASPPSGDPSEKALAVIQTIRGSVSSLRDFMNQTHPDEKAIAEMDERVTALVSDLIRLKSLGYLTRETMDTFGNFSWHATAASLRKHPRFLKQVELLTDNIEQSLQANKKEIKTIDTPPSATTPRWRDKLTLVLIGIGFGLTQLGFTAPGVLWKVQWFGYATLALGLALVTGEAAVEHYRKLLKHEKGSGVLSPGPLDEEQAEELLHDVFPDRDKLPKKMFWDEWEQSEFAAMARHLVQPPTSKRRRLKVLDVGSGTNYNPLLGVERHFGAKAVHSIPVDIAREVKKAFRGTGKDMVLSDAINLTDHKDLKNSAVVIHNNSLFWIAWHVAKKMWGDEGSPPIDLMIEVLDAVMTEAIAVLKNGGWYLGRLYRPTMDEEDIKYPHTSLRRHMISLWKGKDFLKQTTIDLREEIRRSNEWRERLLLYFLNPELMDRLGIAPPIILTGHDFISNELFIFVQKLIKRTLTRQRNPPKPSPSLLDAA